MNIWAGSEYNIVPEIVVLMVAILFIVFMSKTQPRRTLVFGIDFGGMIVGAVALCCNLLIYFFAAHVEYYHEKYFQILVMIYFMLYVIVLSCVFNYILLLSPENRRNFQAIVVLEHMYGTAFLLFLCYFLFTGQMYVVTNSGIHFTKYFYAYLYFGILDAFFCALSVFFSRKYITKVVRTGILMFVPVVLLFLALQLLDTSTVFIGSTYVLPFVVFYVLFHSNPYNEQIGCQNKESFESRFMTTVNLKKKYVLIHLNFSQLRVEGIYDPVSQMEYVTVDKCRKAEKLHGNLHIFYMGGAEYIIQIEYHNREKAEQLVEEIKEILEEPVKYKKSTIRVSYKMITLFENPYLTDTMRLEKFLSDRAKLLEQTTGNCSVTCTEEDFRFYLEQSEIAELLMDIRNKGNLDDPRVLCYAQPIYSIRTDDFRSAEALMRLSHDGKILYPDKFISLAEQMGCIHILTSIMLNKVCRQIKEMEGKYAFDAITINCSTIEMSDENLHRELMEIIDQNQVESSTIRLELTENATTNNYASVVTNMEALNKGGVRFYLDDFGTGYSNLERIVTLPFMTIKFDKSILYKAMNDENMRELVANMVQVFKKKGLIMLIEGVENDEQSEFSVNTGFDLIQGYKYAKPIPISELIYFFRKSISQ